MVLPHYLSLAKLLQADAITICLENQKNGHRDAMLHHTTSGHALCLVRCAALRCNLGPSNCNPQCQYATWHFRQCHRTRHTGLLMQHPGCCWHWHCRWQPCFTRLQPWLHWLSQHPVRWCYAPQTTGLAGLLVQQHLSHLYSIPNWEPNCGHCLCDGAHSAFP